MRKDLNRAKGHQNNTIYFMWDPAQERKGTGARFCSATTSIAMPHVSCLLYRYSSYFLLTMVTTISVCCQVAAVVSRVSVWKSAPTNAYCC